MFYLQQNFLHFTVRAAMWYSDSTKASEEGNEQEHFAVVLESPTESKTKTGRKAVT